MESLTVVAGVTTTFSGALYAVRNLHKFVCTINGGPADILSILKDVGALADVLAALEACLALGLVQKNAVDALEMSLENCTRTAIDLENILRPFTKKVHTSYLRWTSSFKWALKKSEVKDCVGRLSVSKQTLIITLGVINTYAVEYGNEEVRHQLQANTDSIQAKLAVISADVKTRAKSLRRSDSIYSKRGSLFNGTDSSFPLRRFLEEMIPDDHPWAGANDISEILSLNTLTTISNSRPVSLLTLNPDTSSTLDVLDNKVKLQRAITWGDVRTVMDLAQKGVDLDQVFSSSDTCLHMCARANDFQMTEVLLWKGASVHIVNRDLQTPLCVALNSGNLETVRVLIDQGAMMRDLLSWMAELSSDCLAGTKQLAKSCIEYVADSGDENLQEDFISTVGNMSNVMKRALEKLWQGLDLPIDFEDGHSSDEPNILNEDMSYGIASYFSASSDSSNASTQIAETRIEHSRGIEEFSTDKVRHLDLSSSMQIPLSDESTDRFSMNDFPGTPDSDSREFLYLHDGGQAVVWRLHEAPERIAVLTERHSFHPLTASMADLKRASTSDVANQH